jgi:hypothetical protein
MAEVANSTAAPPNEWPISSTGGICSAARYALAHIRCERRIREIALALAEAGEVEAQHRDARRVQAAADRGGRFKVFATGKTVRKQRKCARRSLRQIESRRELLACCARERNTL